jgi:putative ABC transport system permease protein
MNLPRLRVIARVGLRMMFYDRAKFVGTLLGVVFAVVLGVQQLSILLGLLDKNTTFVEHSGADVWIVPPGTTLLQPGPLLDDSVLARARTTKGVAVAEPLIFGGATIKKPNGGTEPVTLVGTALPASLGGPWSVVAGTADAIAATDTVIFEDSEREKFGNIDIGSLRELNGRQVRVGGFTWGLVPFGPAYAFAEINLARDLVRVPTNKMNFVLVKVRPGENIEEVRSALALRVPEHRVVLRTEYQKSIVSTLLREQLGASFATSTSFGLIIGFVIVALSMFSSVIDNLREFGTLKAIGCGNLDLSLLLFAQAAIYALLGSLIGLALVSQMTEGIRSPKLVPLVPVALMAGVAPLMLGICLVASLLGLSRIRKLEPGMVFR